MAADRSQRETDDNIVEFSKVTTLCKRWMIDFHFVSMCRYFKEDQLEEFEETVINLDAILGSMPLINFDLSQKRSIVGFVNRVMHGKDLDMHYDGVKETPLISAINIWKLLKDTVADDRLFEDISNLLYVQSVAVCLETGQGSMASTVLNWLWEECEIPRNLGIKLSSMIKSKDSYHSYLLNFSFDHLLDAILNFLQAYLKLHPCDFLLKAATKVVKVCPDQLEDSGTEESETQPTSESTPVTEDNKETPVKKPKKKLLSIKNELPWKPESEKKPVVVLRRIGKGGFSLFIKDGDRLQLVAASPARPELKSKVGRRKAATKVVKVCPDQLEDLGTEESETQPTSESTPVTEDNKETPVKKPKKKLLSIKNELPWKPESEKKPVVVLSRIKKEEDGDRLQPVAASPARPELKSKVGRRKAATKVVKVCPDQLEDLGTEESETQPTSESTPVTEDNKETLVKKPKKKLLSIKNELPWKPESEKKPVVVLSRIKKEEDGDRLQPVAASPARPELKSKVRRRKWTAVQDKKLKEGVGRFGVGKWSKILLFYNFEDRTGVMLKDRWRILKKRY